MSKAIEVITSVERRQHCGEGDDVQDRGGWQNRDTAEAFADYAGYVVEKLSDRRGTSSR